MDSILIFQSCDPHLYFPMLAATQRTAALYAKRKGYRYEAFVGIKRGLYSWHACFNRIIMLCEMVQRGERGWVLYLDADSYVVDFNFDCGDYLKNKRGKSFIMAPGGPDANPWNFNDGIFFADLGNLICQELCFKWLDEFKMTWPDEKLVQAGDEFQYPADQEILQEIIKAACPEVQNSIYLDLMSTFNYQDGLFARQVIRAHHSSLDERLVSAEKDIEIALRRLRS